MSSFDAPSWLDKYVAAGEKVQAQTARAREKQAEAHAKMRPQTNPILPPVPKGTPKEEARRDQMHPLLAPPRFTSSAMHPGEIDARMHFIDSHLAHRDHAEAAVQGHRDAAAAEQERLNQPHPMTQRPWAK